MEALYKPHALFGLDDKIPTFVQDVQFHGIVDTKLRALRKEISGLYNSRTLHELIMNSYLAANHMKHVGLFDQCVPVIDTTENSKDSYTVNFYVKEPVPLKASANCGISMCSQGEVNFSAVKGSALGAGESLSATFTKLIKSGYSFDFTAIKPLLGWQRFTTFTGSMLRRVDTLKWNKSEVTQNNVVCELNRCIFENRVNHTTRFYLSWRYLRARQDTVFPVREHAGHTSKISIENIFTYDTRDRPLLPKRGIMARLTNEYAGLLGDAAFVKNQLELHLATTLPYGFIFGASGRIASVDGLTGPIGRNIHLLDRIYMGGPYDMRGFEMNSMGTRVKGSSLGGAFGLVGALHLYKTLVPKDILYGHLFLSAGGISSVRSRNRLGDVIDNPRVTAGIGLAFVYGNVARLEVNYVLPLRFVHGDACSPGIHVGAGINFL